MLVFGYKLLVGLHIVESSNFCNILNEGPYKSLIVDQKFDFKMQPWAFICLLEINKCLDFIYIGHKKGLRGIKFAISDLESRN